MDRERIEHILLILMFIAMITTAMYINTIGEPEPEVQTITIICEGNECYNNTEWLEMKKQVERYEKTRK